MDAVHEPTERQSFDFFFEENRAKRREPVYASINGRPSIIRDHAICQARAQKNREHRATAIRRVGSGSRLSIQMRLPTMTVPLIFVWPHALAFWALVVWVTVPETRLLSAAKKTGALRSPLDAGTGDQVVWGTYAALIVAIAAAFIVPAASLPRREIFFVAGLGLLLAGGLLRRHCFRMLGGHFTYAVQVAADQPVIQTGAYKLLRHPSYLAGLLLFAGWGLALTNWVSIAALIVAPLWFYSRRIAVEERALLASMGDRYRAYMNRTKRLVPFLY